MLDWVKKAKVLNKAQIPILMIEGDAILNFGSPEIIKKIIGNDDKQIVTPFNEIFYNNFIYFTKKIFFS